MRCLGIDQSGTRNRKRTVPSARRAGLAAAIGALALIASAAHAATITVGTLSDSTGSGSCSLRDAITTANGTTVTNGGCGSPGVTNTINFSITGTIALGSTLPAINGNLTIAGP